MGVVKAGGDAGGRGELIDCICVSLAIGGFLAAALLLAMVEMRYREAVEGGEEGMAVRREAYILFAGRRMEGLVLFLDIRQDLCIIV